MNAYGRHQVVVIGGGIMGCSAAYFLAREGFDVALVERNSQVGLEASGRSGGGIRQNGRHLAELPLSMASVKLWQHFRDDLGGNFEYDQSGQMFLARNEEEVADLREGVRVLRAHGLMVQLVEGAELRELCPNLGEMVLAANYCPTDGYAEPFLATLFVAQCARKAGATVYLDTRVAGLKERDGRVYAVQTSRGDIETETVVSTAGPWTNDITGSIGVRLPVSPRPTQAAVTLPVPPTVRQFISGNRVWMRQARSGNLVVGGVAATGSPQEYSKETGYDTLRDYSIRGSQLLPALARTNWIRSWAGTLAMTQDRLIILDRIPGIENMVFATGCSGHGFCVGPAVGRVLTDMVQGRDPSVPIDGLRLSRFTAA